MTNTSYDDLAVSKLLSSLVDPDPLVRREAASELGLMLPKSEKVILALGTAINDNDKDVAQNAGIALFSYGRMSRLVIPAVVRALQHWDICVRRVAAGILYMIGPEGKMAAPLLESMIADPDPLLRGWVAQALDAIKGKVENQQEEEKGDRNEWHGL